MQWIELAKERPPIVGMGQTAHILVAYYHEDDELFRVTIGFFDQDGDGSGWREQGTYAGLPAPRYWMSIPSLPISIS